MELRLEWVSGNCLYIVAKICIAKTVPEEGKRQNKSSNLYVIILEDVICQQLFF